PTAHRLPLHSWLPHPLPPPHRSGGRPRTCRRAVWTSSRISRWRSGAGKLSHPGSSPLPGWSDIGFGSAGLGPGVVGPGRGGSRIVLTSTRFLPLPEVAHEGGEIPEADQAERRGRTPRRLLAYRLVSGQRGALHWRKRCTPGSG